MAHKVNVDEIDERMILSSVRKDQIKQEITPPPLVPLPAIVPSADVSETVAVAVPVQPEEPAAVEIIASQSEHPKEKRKAQEYETLFIKETDLPPARFGKSVYIRKEHHERIAQIISVIGGNEVSLSGYIDNVLAHHLESYREEITRSFKKKIIFK